MIQNRHAVLPELLPEHATVSFKYDPFGRRIYKSSSTATSIFAYDGDNLIEETNSSGAAVARYTQTGNVDEPVAMLRSGATSYYHADGLGSVTSLSNAAGTLAQTYTFDSFGNQTASSGSLTNPFRYTGRELDPETSLYFYRARYYDATAGGAAVSLSAEGIAASERAITAAGAVITSGPAIFPPIIGAKLGERGKPVDCGCEK